MKLPETYEELEEFVYNKEKHYFKKNKQLYKIHNCFFCNEECFVISNKVNKPGIKLFCSHDCFNKYKCGENNPMYGKTKEKCISWKGGVKNIPLYDTYSNQLPDIIERVKTEEGYLKVKCATCGKWEVPTRNKISNKICNIRSKETSLLNYYCSRKCIYNSSEYVINNDNLNKGYNNPNWKGGYAFNDIPTYNEYYLKLEPIEETRKSLIDENILEVRCTYCNRWYIPKRNNVRSRIDSINGKGAGENRFYCSDECKGSCSIYWTRDYPKGFKNTNDRKRVDQPALRKLVLERDNWKCIKCGNDKDLYCHHFEGIEQNPIESADVDNCATLCKKCHKEAHKEKGCNYYDFRCKK